MELANTATEAYAAAFAFVGNSLLKPMNQTGHVGLDPTFWNAFCDFGSDDVRAATRELSAFVESLAATCPDETAMVQELSVEYTRLFIGPPKPEAAPWETFYRAPDVSVGFGEATFEMRRLLREAGLQVSGESNQYADHFGIELLYLSVLFERASADSVPGQCRSFAAQHPSTWVNAFEQRVAQAAPDGYYRRIVTLARALLESIA